MKKYLYLAVICFLIASCKTSNKQEQMICKTWVYLEMNVDGKKINRSQMGSPIVKFYENGYYKLSYGPMNDTGKWELTDQNIFTTISLKDTSQQSPTQQQSILQLTADTFKVKYLGVATNMQLTMIPFKE